MKDKIVQLMKSEGVTPSRFAEILEIQPSGVSHLVSGRNKPSFELLQKILRRFPNINPYWLLLDDTEMYRLSDRDSMMESTADSESTQMPPSSAIDLFTLHKSPTLPSAHNNTTTSTQSSRSSKIDLPQPNIKRVIVLYDDGSCESFAVQGSLK